MDFENILASMRAQLEEQEKAYSTSVQNTARLGEEYDRSKKADEKRAVNIERTRASIRGLEYMQQAQGNAEEVADG